ncbi:monooxygenase [Subtercola boreus]|uniref:Monooxygenase n=2 Tax=Subtercola boreus TaxID=120213 RepID=A0A3E0WE27_9MICO|nr:monooxygenase [Subtercola boreus]RFA21723.1 monooxygenase [Subtercola boreus]RFA27693.1 monooxygenase [Subtercola boreus]
MPSGDSPSTTDSISTRVCVAGGGPAGVMLGLLLARAGIDVLVLEKHSDFFRDFRGDTVHPSTLNLIDQLGIRAEFDAIGHALLPRLDAVVNGVRLHAINFASLPAPNRAITLMPQWDLLKLLAIEGARSPHFELRMGYEVVDVVRDGAGGRVTGVLAQTAGGLLRIDAELTVAADGRDSIVRKALDLAGREFGVPVDVTWFRLDRPSGSAPDTLGYLSDSAFIVTIPRPEYLQCGLLVPKGSFAGLRRDGIEAFRQRIAVAAPRLATSVSSLASIDDVKLLSVRINRLKTWSAPGALCIGDAAHAMSPVFGVGINYAVQDAVATANLLVPVLRAGGSPKAIDAATRAVQRRREGPTALMQRLQRSVHRIIGTGAGKRVLQNPPTRRQRVALRVAIPIIRPIAARVVGYGFRPERISREVLGEGAARR